MTSYTNYMDTIDYMLKNNLLKENKGITEQLKIFANEDTDIFAKGGKEIEAYFEFKTHNKYDKKRWDLILKELTPEEQKLAIKTQEILLKKAILEQKKDDTNFFRDFMSDINMQVNRLFAEDWSIDELIDASTECLEQDELEYAVMYREVAMGKGCKDSESWLIAEGMIEDK